MFFTLFCSAVIIKFYMIMNVYLKTLPLDPWVLLFILLIMAFAVIDGPNIIERCIGVDVGLSSVFRTTAAIFAGTRTATHMVKSAVGSVGKVASGAESATKGASRGIGRFMGGLDYKHTKQAEQRLKSEASPDSAGESRKVTRDTGGMKEASPPSAGTPFQKPKAEPVPPRHQTAKQAKTEPWAASIWREKKNRILGLLLWRGKRIPRPPQLSLKLPARRLLPAPVILAV